MLTSMAALLEWKQHIFHKKEVQDNEFCREGIVERILDYRVE
jgi:hypothetical protein